MHTIFRLRSLTALGLLLTVGSVFTGCKKQIKPAEEASSTEESAKENKILTSADVDDSLNEHVSGERYRIEYKAEDIAKGASEPLVTIVEFSDFECPYCQKMTESMHKLLEDYPNDVKVVFKQFPLSFHKNAKLAAQASVASNKLGKGWEMHDKLFANNKALTREDIEKYASEVGISDIEQFKKLLDDPATIKQVDDDIAFAKNFAVRSTPTAFINGKPQLGTMEQSKFKELIESEKKLAETLIEKGAKREAVYAHIMRAAKDKRDAAKPKEQARPGRPDPDLSYAVPTDERPSAGPADALVTIVEFSDFQCPFCKKAAATMDEVKKAFSEDVRLVFRNQPLPFHNNARGAAEAALAAGKQGKFWEMHDHLFANSNALDAAKLPEYAKAIGLDVEKFNADMKSSEIKELIDQDIELANKFGARGTPAFFINGRFIAGAQEKEKFEALIREEKEKAEKALAEKGVPKEQLYAELIKEFETEVKAPPPPPIADKKRRDVSIAGLPTKGNAKDPKVTILECSDFDCPFCKRVTDSVNQVEKEYGDKVVLAFGHYPLPFHKDAEPAHRAAQAAANQGKFWEMHDKLFAEQKKRSEEDFVGYAKEFGLNIDKFKKDFADPKTAETVKEQTQACAKLDVRGAPGFLINGRLMVGAQPFDNFKKVIEEELTGGFETADKKEAVAQVDDKKAAEPPQK